MDTLIIIAFVIGYFFITIENKIHVNKAAIAILTGVICWTIYVIQTSTGSEIVISQLVEHVGSISQIIFFLIGAMTIVELIDSYHGFDVITKFLTTNKTVVLLLVICFITFFLSALLDNLTTTIVMITIIRKLLKNKKDLLLFVGMIVISANAGGAWTPIGDVTTTMLWIGGQISTANIMLKLFLPSLISMVVPLALISFKIKGELEKPNKIESKSKVSSSEKKVVFILGMSALIFAPIFKTITHLPPFLGILAGLAVLWVVTELLHKNKEEENKISVSHALQKIDTPSILFFLGILVAVASLESTGLLTSLAAAMNDAVGNIKIISISLGLLSAIIDNVPLVAAAMGMYDMQTYPMDHYFWELIAYCAGTGGSILIIGSAAGVAAMGLVKIDFFWYIKNISLWALMGYFAGAFFYLFTLGF